MATRRASAPTLFGRRMKRGLGRGEWLGLDSFEVTLGTVHAGIIRGDDGSWWLAIGDEIAGTCYEEPEHAARALELRLLKLRDTLCRLTGTVAMDVVMPDMAPGDSKELSKLRAAIDSAGLFPSMKAEERGDYVAAVRSAGRRLKTLGGKR